MKMKRWLKKIVLFPAMMLLGNGTEAGSTETGAVPATATAEAQGSEGSTTATDNTAGAVPGTESAEVQGGQEGQTTTTEGAEGATEGSTASPDKGTHQKTLEERVQELAAKQVSEVETKLMSKLEEVTRAKAAEKPDFYDVDMAKVNEHFATTMAQIEALKVAGDYLGAMELQDGLNDTRKELRANEERKSAFIQRTQAQSQNEQFVAQMQTKLHEAGELVKKEHNILPEVWEKSVAFFDAAMQKSPLLQRQYDEKVMTQGPVAAILFAKEYVEKNMGKKEQELIDKKEAAKQTLPPGKTSTGENTGSADLAALKSKAQASGNAEDLAKYMSAKNSAAAT